MNIQINEIALPGITLDPAQYPGTASAFALAVDLLTTIFEVQETKNAAAGGLDILSLDRAVGQIEVITRLDTGGTFLGRRVAFNLVVDQELSVSSVVPILGNQ